MILSFSLGIRRAVLPVIVSILIFSVISYQEVFASHGDPITGHCDPVFINSSGGALSGADLSGCSLIFFVFTNADFSGADLSGANLNTAFLDGANLSGADLSGASLIQANLSGADLTEANFSGANLQFAVISNAILDRTNFDNANLSNVIAFNADFGSASINGIIIDCGFPGPGIVLINCIYVDAPFSGFVDDLHGAILRNADLTGADLSFVNLSGADLFGALLSGADLFQANLDGADLHCFGHPVCLPDTDSDSIHDDLDNCPLAANTNQLNTDGDGLGDACDPDDDNDGLLDTEEDINGNGILDPLETDPLNPDTDNDSIFDLPDNCPLIANTAQTDTDGDVIGDACDPDDDNDTVLDVVDNCPLIANTDQLDTDGDVIGDACDPDDDNDTVLDVVDNCPLIANTVQTDTDGDGLGDACDETTSLNPAGDIFASKALLIASTFTVSGESTIQNVGVRLSVEHPSIGDLTIAIQSPVGTIAKLHERTGGVTANIEDVLYLGSLADCPTSDTCRVVDDPGLLSNFNGENPNGSWNLLAASATSPFTPPDTITGTIYAGGETASWGTAIGTQLLVNDLLIPSLDWYADCDGDSFYRSATVIAADLAGANALTPCADSAPPDGGWSHVAGADPNDEDVSVIPGQVPLDTDGDGVPDSSDICSGGDDNADIDGDGTPDGCDVQIIESNFNGNDCMLIGTWNGTTNTCTLTTNVSIYLAISNNDGALTVDGNGHTLTSPNPTTGKATVQLFGSGILLKNLTVENSPTAFRVVGSIPNDNVIENNIATNNRFGFTSNSSPNNIFRGNLASFNDVGFIVGSGNTYVDNIVENNRVGFQIAFLANGNILEGNTISSNTISISFTQSENNILRKNTITSQDIELLIGRSSHNNQIYNNNFIADTIAITDVGNGNVFSLPLPDGGNYYSTFDESSENCNDVDADGLCDAAFVFSGGQDDFPWTTQDGWIVVDTDGDGVPDSSDNCPAIVNPGQFDNDNDGKGNACDVDDDNDGIHDVIDPAPLDDTNETFADSATTSGIINNRNGQTLVISDITGPKGGVKIQVSGLPTNAVIITPCGGSSTYELFPGIYNLACRSEDVEVESGLVEATIVANDGSSAKITLDSGDSFSFDNETFTLTSILGTAEITIVADDGTTTEIPLVAGNTITVDPVTSIITADPGNVAPVTVVIDGEVFTIIPDKTLILNRVDIDIKPGGFPSSVDCTEIQPVPVAVFGSSTFDATTINPASLALNGVATPEIHNKVHIEDKNNDGIPDAVLHLDRSLVCGATLDAPLNDIVDATLTGFTTGGEAFEGIGDIRITGR